MKRNVDLSSLAALMAALSLTAACGGDQVVEEPDAGPSTSDAGLAARTVKVTRNGSSTEVSLGDPAPLSLGGVSCARLSDVVALAVTDRAIEQLEATDFLSSDGFSPTSKSNCAALLPLSGDRLAQGYIDLQTRQLKWDEALGFPGCLSVSDTAEIVVADK